MSDLGYLTLILTNKNSMQLINGINLGDHQIPYITYSLPDQLAEAKEDKKLPIWIKGVIEISPINTYFLARTKHPIDSRLAELINSSIRNGMTDIFYDGDKRYPLSETLLSSVFTKL